MPHDDLSIDAGSDGATEKRPVTACVDYSIKKAAVELQERISLHVPVEEGEEWGDVEISLPQCVVPLQRSDQRTGVRDSPIFTELPTKGITEVSEKDLGSANLLRTVKDVSKSGLDEYNENSIQFFREELDPRFDWRLAEDWARKYRRDPDFVLRGIMACRECCVSPTWFLSRYLERDKDAPRREDVEEAHRRLLTEGRTK